MKRLDPDMPLDHLQPMSAYVDDALGQTRLNLVVMAFFGGAALLLSCVGIYGVFSYAVSQRTREIGIRMALGQDARSIRNQVLLDGVRMTRDQRPRSGSSRRRSSRAAWRRSSTA